MPCCTFPKLIEGGVKDRVGTAATPVPLRAEVTEATPLLNGWVKVAVRDPVPNGVNVIPMGQVALGARLAPQLEPKVKSSEFAPVIVPVRRLRLTFPILDNVSVMIGDVTPTVTFPKAAVAVRVAPVCVPNP